MRDDFWCLLLFSQDNLPLHITSLNLIKNWQVNISLWPRFKLVFDMHLNSLRNANIRTLWEDDVHPHYVMRRYAEFTASLVHLNVEYGDGQVAGYNLSSLLFSLLVYVETTYILSLLHITKIDSVGLNDLAWFLSMISTIVVRSEPWKVTNGNWRPAC